MTTVYELPTSPQAQVFTCDVGGTTYTFHLRYNRAMQAWVMDIHDANDRSIGAGGGLNGIPLVPGSDLLGQFRYLGIGGGVPMIVMTIGPGRSPDEVPTYENLGIDAHVYFETLT